MHAESPTFAATDWSQVVALYDLLLGFMPTPVVRLHRAVALRHVNGAAAALDEIDRLGGALDGYHLYHATRGALLIELGREEQARAAQIRALSMTRNGAEKTLLQGRLFR